MSSTTRKILGTIAGVALVGLAVASAAITPSTSSSVKTSDAAAQAFAGSVLSTFPSPTTTGVPAGTALTAYTGPTTITACGTIIDSKTVNGGLTIKAGNGTHDPSTPCVTIKNSLVKGIINDGWTDLYHAGPLVITDTEVAVPTPSDCAAVSDSNYFIWRSYVHGCRSGLQFDGWMEVHDSYLLADKEFGTAHMDAIISNGNSGRAFTIDHSSMLCAPDGSVPNGAGCAADLGLFGDFSAITNGTITNNLLKATSDAYFCVHSGYETKKPFPNGGNLTYTGNIFERGSSGCGANGSAFFQWNNSAGKFCDNVWSDGTGNVLPGNPDNCGSTPPTTVTTTTIVVPPTSTSVAPTTVPAPTTTSTRPPATTTTTKPPATTTTTLPPVTTTTILPTTTTTGPCFRSSHGDKVCQVG